MTSRSPPPGTLGRVARRLRQLEAHPLLGRPLPGPDPNLRLLIGPWPWMLVVYRYREAPALVEVVSIQDARTSTAWTTEPPESSAHA